MGKKAFFLDMLRKYIENQGDTPALIRQSLDTGDRAAADVEKAFKEGQSPADIEPTLAVFAGAHATFIALLKQALPSQEDTAAQAEIR